MLQPSFKRAAIVLSGLVLTVGVCTPVRAAEASRPSEAGADRFVYQKFLLIDDQSLVKNANLKRRVNQATKRPQPVMTLDAPWETDRDWFNNANVIYDEDERIYKMWYTLMRWQGETTDGPRGVAYATSEDGLRWKKPVLGIVEVDGSRENNMVIPFMRQFAYSIIRDPSDVPFPTLQDDLRCLRRRITLGSTPLGLEPGLFPRRTPLGTPPARQPGDPRYQR